MVFVNTYQLWPSSDEAGFSDVVGVIVIEYSRVLRLELNVIIKLMMVTRQERQGLSESLSYN